MKTGPSNPPLEWFSSNTSYLTKRINASSKTETTNLEHKDSFFADDSGVIFLSKEDLATRTQFVNDYFKNLASKFITEIEPTKKAHLRLKPCISPLTRT